MKFFVTGASGFIGSSLCKQLVSEGHEVLALVRSPQNAWRLKEIRDEITMLNGDLTDLEGMLEPIKDFSPDVICHLAWEGVANSDRDSSIQGKNIGLFRVLIDIAQKVDIKCFIGLGSQAEYGPKNNIITISDTTNPTSSYGETKLACFQLGQAIAQEKGFRFVWLRVFSTYGATDNPHWVFPYVIHQIMQGRSPELTKCEQLWDFLHVSDAAKAIRAAALSENAIGVYNLGSGTAPPLSETLSLLRDQVSPDIKLQFGAVPYRVDQVMHLKADISDLKRDCDWQPEVSLVPGLQDTVDWYTKNTWIFETK